METLVFLTIRKTAGKKGHDEDHAELAAFAQSRFTRDVPSSAHTAVAPTASVEDKLSLRWGETVKSKFEGQFFDFLENYTNEGVTDFNGFRVKVSHQPFHGKVVHDMEYWCGPYKVSVSWIQ